MWISKFRYNILKITLDSNQEEVKSLRKRIGEFIQTSFYYQSKYISKCIELEEKSKELEKLQKENDILKVSLNYNLNSYPYKNLVSGGVKYD